MATERITTIRIYDDRITAEVVDEEGRKRTYQFKDGCDGFATLAAIDRYLRTKMIADDLRSLNAAKDSPGERLTRAINPTGV